MMLADLTLTNLQWHLGRGFKYHSLLICSRQLWILVAYNKKQMREFPIVKEMSVKVLTGHLKLNLDYRRQIAFSLNLAKYSAGQRNCCDSIIAAKYDFCEPQNNADS